MTAPTVNLTGGTLVLNPAASPGLWQADFNNQGSTIIEKLNAVIQTTVGDTTHPGNFAMSSGAWNIDIASNAVATGADRFVTGFAGSTGSLTGGSLNLNYISGYSPTVGDSIMIVRVPATGSVALNAPGVTINAPGGDPNWSVQTATVGSTNFDLRLVYVPEPSSCVLGAVGLMMGLAGFRRRS
jgi:hypothetical protein